MKPCPEALEVLAVAALLFFLRSAREHFAPPSATDERATA